LSVFILIITIVFLLFTAVVHFRKKEECPKVILGYGYCNRWRDQECDHSPAAVESAKMAMKSNKLRRHLP
jgi:hypothetical protein